jgi:hypothetical protein
MTRTDMPRLMKPAPGENDSAGLTTRIPKRLHYEVKLHCVQTNQSMADFVAVAVRERLRREGGRSGR